MFFKLQKTFPRMSFIILRKFGHAVKTINAINTLLRSCVIAIPFKRLVKCDETDHWPSSSGWSFAEWIRRARCCSRTLRCPAAPTRLPWRTATSGCRTTSRTPCPPSSRSDRPLACTTHLSDCKPPARRSPRWGTRVWRSSPRRALLLGPSVLNDCLVVVLAVAACCSYSSQASTYRDPVIILTISSTQEWVILIHTQLRAVPLVWKYRFIPKVDL